MNTRTLLRTFWRLLPVLALLVACKSNEPEAPKAGEAKLASFGFYREDNPDLLFMDYEVNTVEANLSIALPKEAEKTALVARFTTTDSKAVVKVNGTVQESRVSKNDFTAPVDYIVSNGTNNTKYTVTITAEADRVWQEAGLLDVEISSFTMRINPVDGLPYALITQNNKNSDERKPALYKFENGAWLQVGSLVAENGASELSLTFDKDGKPYVAYSDPSKDAAKRPSVRYYNGSAWAYAGTANITEVAMEANSLAFDAKGKLFLFAVNSKNKTPLHRKLIVNTFDANAWTANQTLSVRNNDELNAKVVRSLLHKSNIYLAMNDYANDKGTVSVYTCNEEGQWKVVKEELRLPESTESNYRDLALNVDAKGRVYVMSMEKTQEKYQLVIHRHEPGTEGFNPYASPIELYSSSARYYDLAFSASSRPYVIYRGSDNKYFCNFVDPETKTWTTTPHKFDTESDEDADLGFAPSGLAYVAMKRKSDNKLVLFQYK